MSLNTILILERACVARNNATTIIRSCAICITTTQKQLSIVVLSSLFDSLEKRLQFRSILITVQQTHSFVGRPERKL